MSYASRNHTAVNKSKAENNCSNGRNEFQNIMKKSRTWGRPDVPETTSNNSSENVIQQNSSDKIMNVTQPTHNKKKANWYKLSDFNSNVWESHARKQNISSTRSNTSSQMLTTLSGNNTASIDPHSATLQNTAIEKNIGNNNNPCDKTDDAVADTGPDSNNFVIDIEEKRQLRRERQKIKKEKKKEEKAVLREEEMLKKRLLSKSQKVTIIDHNTLDKFLLKDAPPSRVGTKEVIYTGDEFPSLGEVFSASHSVNYKKKCDSRARKSKARDAACEKKQTSQETETSTLHASSTNQSAPSRLITRDATSLTIQSKSQQGQTDFELEQTTEDSKKVTKVLEDKGKRPKRRDPIQLDINEILKVQETKHEVTIKMHTNKMPPKTEIVRYSGNILDSDNPERKRGKQREVPKAKRPSNLKQIILQERAKRKEARCNDSKAQVDESEKNLSNSKDKKSTDDFVAPCECFPNSVYAQVESINSAENELQANSPNCNSENLTDVDAQIDRDVHLQLENAPITKQNSDEQCKESTIQSSCSMSSVSKNRSTETCNNIEEISPTCQQSLETHVTLAKDKDKVCTRKIHSRKFREYCDHCITPEILTSATALLEDIVKFHDRQYARSPLKASAKRRHVTGLKEVRRFLTLRRIRLLVIAPDLEPNSTSGGLDDIVAQLKESAAANCVPYVFALGRRQLGYILKKKVPVSCVGVLNYDGTENNFRDLMSGVEKAREDYKLRISQISPLPQETTGEINDKTEDKETTVAGDDVNREVVASLLAKLTAPRARNNSSPFLDAIERCNSLDTDYEDEDSVQEHIF